LDLPAAAAEALDAPRGGAPLRELARPRDAVTLVITDATRPCPDPVFVPAILERLEAAGVARERITVLIALGMHRPCTEEERRGRLGPAYGSVRLEEAQGANHAEYRDAGTLTGADVPGIPSPVPVRLHRCITDADLVISTGIVEPHQYAGFSGGAKTVAIGCAGEETIRAIHGVPFLEHAGTRLGVIEDNPMQRTMIEIGRLAGLRLVLNVARAPGGEPVAVAAGLPDAVHAELVRAIEPYTWTPVGADPFDAVLAGVAAPKDANLYQASRALTYLAFLPRPVLRDGAWVVLSARCPEGTGQGPGEKEFAAKMHAADSPEGVLAELRRGGFGAGGQRAFMLARALRTIRGGIVHDGRNELSGYGLEIWKTPGDAIRRIAPGLGRNARILLVPSGLGTLPTPDPIS
jgi:nickel-dependent lactate racemase